MFKSPVNKTPSTASGFNFIRNNIGPRQVKPNHISSAKILSASDLESNDHVLKPDGSSTIMLDLLEEGLSEPRRLAYTYQADTNIENLIDFVKQETHITRLNFKTKNVNLDYLLTLKHRKVKELNIRKLSLMLERVKI